MGDTKPFAQVVERTETRDRAGGYEIQFDGRQMMHEPLWPTRDLPDEIVQGVNAAVDAREAKLRGRNHALRMIAAEMGDAATHMLQRYTEFDRRQRVAQAVHAFREHMLDVIDEDDEYVSGHVACGLAWDLGATQAKVEGSWGVLLDAMLEVDTKLSAQVAVKLGAQLGIDMTLDRVTKMMGALQHHTQHLEWTAPDLSSASDDQLLAELRRRRLNEQPEAAYVGQHQWSDATGTWHNYDGRGIPAEARQLRVVYRGNAAAEARAPECQGDGCANNVVYGQDLCRVHLQVVRLSQQNATLLENLTRFHALSPPPPIHLSYHPRDVPAVGPLGCSGHLGPTFCQLPPEHEGPHVNTNGSSWPSGATQSPAPPATALPPPPPPDPDSSE